MSFTKVAPAGIGTEPGTSIRIGDSLLHSTGIDIGTGSGIGVTIRQHGDATFTGVVTASSFSGDITGKATELATNATGTNLTLSGNLGVAGVLTYEDVTNVDSIGIVTARGGIRIGTGGTVGPSGSGIVTYFGDGSQLTNLPVSSEFSFGSTGITTTKNLGINTSTIDNYETVGAANSFRGIYIGDGSLIFNSRLDNINGYYIGTGRNALNAGPITLGSTMTLDGAWVIV